MSRSKLSPCLDPATLERFLHDRLDEAEEERAREHMDACSACQGALERAAAAGDPELWDDLRDLGADDTDGASDAGGELEEVKALLHPSDDPAMLGRLGHYEVAGLIGRGSTGFVLKALEPRLNRFVAIKLLAPSFAASGVARARFEREGRAVAAVSHEHVVPIHAVDEHRGLPYIVMRYVPGLSLQQRIDGEGPLDTCEATRVGLQVAGALAAAHAQGIVHRDVKPANVLIGHTVDRAMVTDFGLARVADEASMTRSGTIAGTPHFMSPEQARGDAVDPRSDLFSLGGLMYTACTGRPPFRAETVFGVLNRVCETEPRPIREIRPEIQAWLAAFVSKLMAKRPEDRFQSAEEVRGALASELAHLQNPTTVAEPPREWLARPKAAWMRSAGLAVAALAGAAAIAVGGFALLGQEGGGEPGDASLAGMLPAGFGQLGDAALLAAEEGSWSTEDGDESAPVFRQLVERTVIADPGERLEVLVDHGDVEVLPHDIDQLTVRVVRRVQAGSQEEAEALVANHSVRLEEEGLGYRLRGAFHPGFLDSEDAEHIDGVHYEILVPRAYSPEVSSLSGAISIGELQGDVDATSGAGPVRLARIDGTVDVEARGGDVDLAQGCTGAVDVLVIHGDVVIALVDGAGYVRASDGNVRLGANTGEFYVQTSGGDVEIDGVAGSLSAYSSYGDVRLRLAENPAENTMLGAVAGDVHIEVAADVAAEVQTRGDFVTPFATEEVFSNDGTGEPWSVSRLNDGEVFVRATSSMGEVVIASLDAPERLAAPAAMSSEVSAEAGGEEEAKPSEGLVAKVQDGDSPEAGGAGKSKGSDKSAGSGGSGKSGGSGGSGLGGSGLGGSGLGGSGLGGSGLGGSGLGGSGLGGSGSSARLSAEALRKTQGDPRAGGLVSVSLGDDAGAMDGYNLYLPVSFDDNDDLYPVLVYLQGGWGVGGEIGDINNWGLARLLRDESDLSIERNQLLLDRFIVVSPHIQNGQYYDHPMVIQGILDHLAETYRADPDRVYLTGLSRGAYGSWVLPERLPGTFAAIVPIGGDADEVEDFRRLQGPAMWVAHNVGDGVTAYARAQAAVRSVEEALGVEFRRFDQLDVAGTDYLEHRHLFTTGQAASHDAWTETYSRPELYRWLLQQRRAEVVLEGDPK
ncbi:MAG: protein kinase [Planctomycetota bacterium]